MLHPSHSLRFLHLRKGINRGLSTSSFRMLSKTTPLHSNSIVLFALYNFPLFLVSFFSLLNLWHSRRRWHFSLFLAPTPFQFLFQGIPGRSTQLLWITYRISELCVRVLELGPLVVGPCWTAKTTGCCFMIMTMLKDQRFLLGLS